MSQVLGKGGVPTVDTNPASPTERVKVDRTRVPMSLPNQKLSAPEIPGYHTHWMRGDAVRINQALRAGYTFVEQDEVGMNTFGIADGAESDGHTDLGSRVSVIAGRGEDGGAERLYLMKLPMEYREQDVKEAAKRQESIAASLRGDKGFSEGGMDTSHRYAGKQSNENKNLFIPKHRS